MTGPLPNALPFTIPENRWSEEQADALSPAELLLYRSNVLGSDLTVTNFGGGNTSAKLRETDPLTGEDVDVLWVKGSGGVQPESAAGVHRYPAARLSPVRAHRPCAS